MPPKLPTPLPAQAAWRHVGAGDGFEVVFCEPLADGFRLSGSTSAVEDGEAWAVAYRIEVDLRWHTRRAHVRGRSGAGERYDYASPAFGFRCVLTYAPDGLVRDYPGIAVRAA